jgi:hypothetical protein
MTDDNFAKAAAGAAEVDLRSAQNPAKRCKRKKPRARNPHFARGCVDVRLCAIVSSGRGGARTLTGVTPHGILSPGAPSVFPDEDSDSQSSAAFGAAVVPVNATTNHDLVSMIETMPVADLATILRRRPAIEQAAIKASL